MVLGAVGDGAERRAHLQAAEGGDERLGVGAAGLAQPRGDGLDSVVAHHRAGARIVLEALAIGGGKGVVVGCEDGVPGVAGDHPAQRRLALQRVQVLGLAREQADHALALEQAARIALADKLGEIGREQHVEDGVRPGISQRLHHAAGVHLAQRCGLLGDKLHIRLRCGKQLLERGHGRLAVLVIGVDDGPALFLHGRGLGHQHGHLHVGRGAQAEGVAVALFPDDLVGQRLGGQEEALFLLREVGQRQPHMRQKAAHEHVHLLARDQLLGGAHGVGRVAVVVARDQHQLLAANAAGDVDLRQRQLHALLVGLEEGRLGLVAVDLANGVDILRLGRAQGAGQHGQDGGE